MSAEELMIKEDLFSDDEITVAEKTDHALYQNKKSLKSMRKLR